MMNSPTLLQITAPNDFIISAIAHSTKWTCPFVDKASDIDMDYYFNRSGSKTISPLVSYMLQNNDTLTQDATARLADIAISKYSERWLKEWATTQFTYNPIQNYDMVETEDITGSGSTSSTTTYDTANNETRNLTNTTTGTHTNNDNKTEKLSNTRTNNLTDDSTNTLTNNLKDVTDNTVTNNLKDITDNTVTNNLKESRNLTDTTTFTDYEDKIVKKVQNTGDDITANSGKDTIENSEDTTKKVFGFNSSEGVNSDSSHTQSKNDTTHGHTVTLTHGLNVNDDTTETKNGSMKVETKGTIDNTGNVVTKDEVNHTGNVVTKDEVNHTGTAVTDIIESHTGTITDNGSNTVEGSSTLSINDTETAGGTVNTSHTGTDSTSGSSSDTTQRTLTRSGNIGVTTSQQMIEAERNLWNWNFFNEVLYPDLDELLTLQIYA